MAAALRPADDDHHGDVSESSDRDRIAIVVASMGGGGAERAALNLAEEFASRGLTIDLVLIAAEGELLQKVPPGVRQVDLGAGRARRAVGRLRKYLKRERPAALISVAFHVNILAALSCIGLGRDRPQLMLTVHGTLSHAVATQPAIKRLWFIAATALLYRLADQVVAVSRGAAQDLGLKAGLDPDRITTIYNPVIRADFDALTAKASAHPWTIDKDRPLIVSVGRLTAAKDYATLVRAFAKVTQATDARLLILGEGERRGEVESIVSSLGLDESVALPGFVDNPFADMRAADAFVLSSRWEGLPTVLVEAMATGTPVIATDCPHGPREILEDGKWGQLVPVGDADALSHAILEVLRTGGVDARKRARDFTVEAAADQYLAALDRKPHRDG